MENKRTYDSQLISQKMDEIRDCVNDPAFDKYFNRLGKQRENLLQLIATAGQKISDADDSIQLNQLENIKILSLRWVDFRKIVANKITDENVKRFKALYRDTRSSVNRIVSLPKGNKILRTRPSISIIKDIQTLENTRKHIQQQIDHQDHEKDKDVLMQKLKVLETQMAKMLKEKDAVQKEEQIEKNWDTKIQQAFVALKQCTSAIEEEKSIASKEYQRIINIIYVVCVITVVWLLSIYKAIFVTHVYFTGWISFLPYYLPIPLFFVVFWVLIVQKNRASKLSITLSDELYRIRYMEGVLLAINKLSDNSESSISRINKALDVMVESFLHQVEKTNIDEKGIEAIEEKELNSNKYIQIIDKLIGKL